MRTRSQLLTAGVLAVAFLVSCRAVASLHGLFGPNDLVLDGRLVGVWQADSGARADRWVIARFDSTAKTYDLAIADSRVAAALLRVDVALLSSDSGTLARIRRDAPARARRARDSVTVSSLYSDAGGPRVFTLGLGRLAGVLFADITPDPFNGESHLGRDLLQPVHWFWRAEFVGDGLRLTPLDEDWLGTEIDSGRVAIAHEDIGDRIVLTAPAADLQRLVTAHAQDSLAFPPQHAVTLRR